jgi:hypothetical protein
MTTNGPADPASALAAQTAPPFQRWLQRQLDADAPRLAIYAALQVHAQLGCARALAETVAPGAFSREQTLDLEAALADAWDRMTPEAAAALAPGLPAPGGAAPIDAWAQGRRAQNAPATELACARAVLDRMLAAREVALAHYGPPASPEALLGLYEALGPSEETGEPTTRERILADLACADAMADTLIKPVRRPDGRSAGFSQAQRVALLEHIAVARVDIEPESVEPIEPPADISRPFDAWLAARLRAGAPTLECVAAALVMETLRAAAAIAREQFGAGATAGDVLRLYERCCAQEAALADRAARESGAAPPAGDDGAGA